MPEAMGGADRRQELVDVIHRVRNRWRMKLALRGALIVVGGTLVALLLSAGGLEFLRFTPTAIIGFRVAALIVFAGLVWFGLVQPLRRRVTDGQVALYLEEKDPTLEAAILSAVEASTRAGAENGPSPQLVERLVEQAIERCHALNDGLAVEREGLRRNAMAIGAIAAAAALLIAFGPAFLRHGLSALLIPLGSVEAATPYRIFVEPGDVRIPRGADQSVVARLDGFSSQEATLMFRNSPGAPYEPIPLVAGVEPGVFEVMLFAVQRETEYFVQSNGVRSATYKMSVVDLPTVENLALEYHFPGYTNLQPRTVDPGGDIAAVAGTEVRLTVTPTMSTNGGRIRLGDGDAEAVPLTVQEDGTLIGTLTVSGPGVYRIELDGPGGEQVNASPRYTIDVLEDMPPSVAFRRPGRDTQATAVEEVFAEVRADDDFGVSRVQLFYSVNGGEEKTINLFGGSRPLPEVTATHTLYLEELGLEPGDFVSYYARAMDNDAVAGAKATTSDIYFVQIRPFRTDFRQAQSQGGGGGGGAGQQVGQLSQQQRQIVSATFNLVRDRNKMTADKFRETAVFLTLAQARLREQVEELSTQMNSRLDVVDPAFRTIAEVLPKAAAEMQAAEGDLKALRAREALNPEQRALKLLQDAEQQYEMQVAMQNGGGGGGGGQQMANDLADLFELELDKLENQYEMQQRAELQSGDRQVDELLEKLNELARRQQQEAERQRRMAQSGRSTGSSGDLQRALAQEAEEAARRLEQLTREQQRQELAQAARELQEAARAMREAAANGSSDGGAQAQAALDRLRQAQQRLQRNQEGRAQRDVQDAERRAEQLARQQREVAAAVEALDQAGADRGSRAQQLAQRKDEMEAQVNDLQRQIEQIANEARREDRNAARRLDEAAGSISDNRIREKIRYTRNTLAGNRNDYARAMEQDIASNLEALARKLGEAREAFGEAEAQNALDQAIDQTRDLVRGMESLEQRMQDAARRGGQQGQQQGQQGQQSQDGQQQSGQQGQQGQQGGQQGGSQAQGGSNSPTGGPQDGGAAGYGAAGGDWRGGWRGGPWTEDDVRQFRRELQQWQADAQELRRLLQQAGVDPRELDGVLRDLRNLSADQNFVDPRSLQELQAAALDRLKQFEFSLRRQAEASNEPLSLSASDEVPAGFRDAIAEYYRSLARPGSTR